MAKVIGIDIGGTKINACLVDEKGNILERHMMDTEASKGRDVVLENIKNQYILFHIKKQVLLVLVHQVL